MRLLKKQESRKDGTRKYLFEVEGGSAIESVFYEGTGTEIPRVFPPRPAAGWAAFSARRESATGAQSDGGRNRRSGGGHEQGIPVRGSVISSSWGTGEPFDNYDELLRAIRILHDENGLNIGLRNITVSTCGLLSKIQRFAEDMPQVNLAVPFTLRTTRRAENSCRWRQATICDG